jgi:putative addiction module CopG family antidote
MNISVPLTPHLQQFLREQMATGYFQTENEIIAAALRLLEDQTHARPRRDQGTASTAWEPRAASWQELRNRLNTGATGRGAREQMTRRSPRGILADIRSNISLEDFKEARRELWAGLPRGSVE